MFVLVVECLFFFSFLKKIKHWFCFFSGFGSCLVFISPFFLQAGVFGYWIWFGFHFTFLLRQVFLDIGFGLVFISPFFYGQVFLDIGSGLVFISPFFYGRCFWILDLIWFSFHLSFTAGVFGYWIWFGFHFTFLLRQVFLDLVWFGLVLKRINRYSYFVLIF